MNKLKIIAAALVILIPLSYWWLSPERAIKRQTNRLMESLTINEGSSRPMRQAKVFSINRLLAPEVKIICPDVPKANGNFDKQEIESAFSWICQNGKKSLFQVTEFQEIEIDGDSAKVRADVEGFMELPSYRPLDGVFDVTISWIKKEGSWRIEKLIWKNR